MSAYWTYENKNYVRNTARVKHGKIIIIHLMQKILFNKRYKQVLIKSLNKHAPLFYNQQLELT